MAKRKFTAKQIRAGFGGKRRKSAMRAKRHAPARKRHAPAAKRRNPSKARRSKPARRRNTGEILVLTAGNPAKKGKAMAKKSYHRRKTKAGAKHRMNAGRRHTTTHKKHHYSSRRRRNPGAIGRPMDWVKGGVGVIAGGVGTRLIPQLVLPANNTGATGYAMNAGAAVLLAWGTHAVTKDKVLTAAVAAGGFAALILRVVNDQSSVGKYLALSGMGDYMVSNWTQPQRITDPKGAMFEMGGGAAMMPAAALQRAGEDGSGNC